MDLRLSPSQRPLCIVGRAGEREKEKESARGTMGRGKKPSSSLPRKSGAILNALYGGGSRLFPLPIVPARFLFFDYCYLYWDTQREPRRRREDLRQMPGSSSLRACSPSGGVARPTCECKARYPSSRLACRNWRACSLAKFKHRRLHVTKLNAKSRKICRSYSLVLGSSHVKLDLWPCPRTRFISQALWCVFRRIFPLPMH